MNDDDPIRARAVTRLAAELYFDVVWTGIPATVLPPADIFLALSATACGRHDDADRHIRDALAIVDGRVCSPYLAAEVRGYAAAVLAGRASAEDTARARQLAGEAIGVADGHGLTELARLAREALARTGADAGSG